VLIAGCTGSLDAPSGPQREGSESGVESADGPVDEVTGAPAPACAAESLAPQPLRRLSSTQYANTIADLFGPTLSAKLETGSLFPATVIKAGFNADAEANVVSSSESHAIEDNAERIAAAVIADAAPFLKALLPCETSATVSDADIEACLDKFIDDFGTRAYRRPITKAEHATARSLFDAVRESQSATLAFAATLQFFVQSPALLYRVERGRGQAKNGVVQLSDYETASRLSFLFTDSMPDAELFEAAKAGKLRTRKQIVAHAERLMKTPRFMNVMAAFHRDWLHLYDLETTARDATLFPEFTPALHASMLRESSEYVRYVLEEGDGSLRTLLGGTTFPIDGELANLYGVKAANPEAFSPVEIRNRRGLLTQAAFLAASSKVDRTNPIHRGAFFQREVLCSELPSLPGNIDTNGPLESSASLPTARERYAPLLENPSCSGCHTQFNPTGLAFEQFDAIGRHRSQENGKTIDASGSINLGDGPKTFDSAVQLVDLVVDSEQVSRCYSTQWYRAALGRREVTDDTCTLNSLEDAMVTHDGDLRELLLAVVRSDAFIFRRASEE